jgi:uncharacterized protein (TIGR02996 family)
VTREADLLAEIVAQPASDAPRLIWADLVGGDRAELVMLQCAASSDRVWGNRRERELLARHGLAWSGLAGLVHRMRFVRGFVEAIEVDVETFLARGEEILSRAPLVNSLTVQTSDGLTTLIDDIIEHPAFANIRAFDLADRVDAGYSRADHAASVLARSGKLAQLTALGGRGFTTAGIAALGATNLERLWLRDTGLSHDDILRLARSTPRLVEVDLDAGYADFAALAELWPSLTTIVLRNTHAGVVNQLAKSPLAPQITRLVVDAERELEAPALRALDRMPLRSLELRAATAGTLRALATIGLPDLRELALASWTTAVDELRAVVTRFAPQLELLDLRRTNRLGPISGDLDVLVDEPLEYALLGGSAKWYVVPPLEPSGPSTMPAWLVCEVGPEPGRVWELGSLGAVNIRLGRGVAVEVSIASPSMARVHAAVIWHDGAFWIRDTRSTNGTRLDGRTVDGIEPLRDGTEITLGAVTLQFFQGDGAGQRATACALSVATHEPLSRLPRATPAGAAELRIANLYDLERDYGWIGGDVAIRTVGRRLRDPAVSSPSRGEFRVFPPERAPALAAACGQPFEHEGLMLEIVIETKPPS